MISRDPIFQRIEYLVTEFVKAESTVREKYFEPARKELKTWVLLSMGLLFIILILMICNDTTLVSQCVVIFAELILIIVSTFVYFSEGKASNFIIRIYSFFRWEFEKRNEIIGIKIEVYKKLLPLREKVHEMTQVSNSRYWRETSAKALEILEKNIWDIRKS